MKAVICSRLTNKCWQPRYKCLQGMLRISQVVNSPNGGESCPKASGFRKNRILIYECFSTGPIHLK